MKHILVHEYCTQLYYQTMQEVLIPYPDYPGFGTPCQMNSCVHIFACMQVCMHILLYIIFALKNIVNICEEYAD